MKLKQKKTIYPWQADNIFLRVIHILSMLMEKHIYASSISTHDKELLLSDIYSFKDFEPSRVHSYVDRNCKHLL